MLYEVITRDNTPSQNRMQAIRGFIKRAPEMPVTQELAETASEEAEIAVITVRRDAGETADRKIKDDFLLTEMEVNNMKTITSAFQST